MTDIQKVNIALDKKIHTQAKLISVLKESTLKDYFQAAIKRAIEKDKHLIEKLLEAEK